MIDCACGKTFLNTKEQEAHAVKAIVLQGDDPGKHYQDLDGQSTVWLERVKETNASQNDK